MRQVDFNSWIELEQYVQGLAKSEVQCSRDNGMYVSYFLYRGQASEEWRLESTLERTSPSLMRLADFYRVIAKSKPQIETFTGKTWSEFDFSVVSNALEEYDTMRLSPLPAYDYLVYLRHHGFPSPLLDWSRSLYVAVYFACEDPKANRVAIFAYQQYAGKGKGGGSDAPQILALGPYVRSHQRHFLQQGEYTIALEFRQNDGWHLTKHSSIFDQDQENQDRLWKFTIPASEARFVMQRLDEYNINAYSLFQTEDALLKTVAYRALIRNW